MFALTGAVALAIFHLALALAGAAHQSDRLLHGPFSGFIAAYQSFSGTNTTFGFFAPGVAPDTRVVLRVFLDGKWHEVFGPAKQEGEAALRMSTLTGLMRYEPYRELLAASWAGWVFGAFPSSKAVVVELQFYALPPLWARHSPEGSWRTLGIDNFLNRHAFEPTYADYQK